MTHTTTDAAEARALTDAQLKDAVTELLSHRGERPWRVLRGGQELWETWLPAFRAALRYLPATAEAASGAGERRFKATGDELTDRLQTALFHSCGEITSEMASAIAANLSEQLRDGDEDWGLRLSLFPDDAASLPPATDPAIPDGWKLVPAGNPVSLNECPPGPFAFNGSLGFRSEYATTLEEPRRYQADAYCFESGEYFWGGAKGTEARGKLIVQPLALAAAPTIPATGEAVPEGMKPWAGGDAAPDDLDLSGKVLREDGQTEAGRDVTIQQWKRPVPRCKWNIIAYTPKATIPATGHAATEGEGA